MKIATLAIIENDGKLLMGVKKRGFGKGILNGPGGKKEINETLEKCMIRETKEELGISIKKMHLASLLEFFFNGDEDWLVFVFSVESFSGTPVESDELKPEWVDCSNIPYERLWSDDAYWLPEVLKGRFVHGVFYYNDSELVDYHLNMMPYDIIQK